MFAGCLAETSSSDRRDEGTSSVDFGDLDAVMRAGTEGEDVAFKNLEGEGARDIAEKWADSGRMRRKLSVMKQYLPTSQRRVVERILDGKYDTATTKIPEPVRRKSTKGITERPRSSSPPARAAEKRKPAFQGRATIEQSEAAMARIQRQPSVPKALRSPEPDSETDDDENHEALAMYLFGAQASTPPKSHSYGVMNADMTSSSLSSSPTQQPIAGPSRLVRLPSEMPLTPTSKRGSQDLSLWLKSSSSPAPEDPQTPCRRTQTQNVRASERDATEEPRTPRRATTLSSPCEVSSAGKRKAIAIPTPDTKIRRLPLHGKGKIRDKGEHTPHPQGHSIMPLLVSAAAVSHKRGSPTEVSPSNSMTALPSSSPPLEGQGPLLDFRNLGKRPRVHSAVGGEDDSSDGDKANHKDEKSTGSPKRRRLNGKTTTPLPTSKTSANTTTALHAPSQTAGPGSAGSHRPQGSTATRISTKERMEVEVTIARTERVNVVSSTSRIKQTMDAIAVSVTATSSRTAEAGADLFSVSPAATTAATAGSSGTPSNSKVHHLHAASKAKTMGKDKSRQDARMERLTIAERLAKAVPAHYVSPSYKARQAGEGGREQRHHPKPKHKDDPDPGESASACASSSSPGPGSEANASARVRIRVSDNGTANKKSSKCDGTATAAAVAARRDWEVPSKLPSQDEEMEQEVAARIAMQRAGFQRQLSLGVRPGLFVPRLRCLESQEE